MRCEKGIIMISHELLDRKVRRQTLVANRTVKCAMAAELLRLLATRHRRQVPSILLTGPSGCGKSHFVRFLVGALHNTRVLTTKTLIAAVGTLHKNVLEFLQARPFGVSRRRQSVVFLDDGGGFDAVRLLCEVRKKLRKIRCRFAIVIVCTRQPTDRWTRADGELSRMGGAAFRMHLPRRPTPGVLKMLGLPRRVTFRGPHDLRRLLRHCPTEAATTQTIFEAFDAVCRTSGAHIDLDALGRFPTLVETLQINCINQYGDDSFAKDTFPAAVLAIAVASSDLDIVESAQGGACSKWARSNFLRTVSLYRDTVPFDLDGDESRLCMSKTLLHVRRADYRAVAVRVLSRLPREYTTAGKALFLAIASRDRSAMAVNVRRIVSGMRRMRLSSDSDIMSHFRFDAQEFRTLKRIMTS